MLNILLAIFVSAAIDSATIAIGDQTDLHLQVTCGASDKVQFPVYGETLIPGIEITDRTIIDTTTTADGQTQYNQYLTLTSFKDSLFYIAPIAFVAGDDSMFSESMMLNVIQPFEVDTTNAITDIKPIAKAPIWWWGIIRWILLALGIAGLIVGIYFLAKKLQNHNDDNNDNQPKEPERPAEEIALEQLDRIREEKIWQAGQTKEYQTQLTDVVREYIARRFDVRSGEKTSDETLRELKPKMTEQKDLFDNVKKILQLADLVKFAKWTTTPDENENALKTAYTFVHETTPVENNDDKSSDSTPGNNEK